MTVEEWIQAVRGDGIIECHTTDKQCAGSAIFRANICKVPRSDAPLRLPRNAVTVFANLLEFRAHHAVDFPPFPIGDEDDD